MTGFTVMAQFGTNEIAMDIDAMPDEQLDIFVSRLSEEKARDWVRALARWIRENRPRPDESTESAPVDAGSVEWPGGDDVPGP